MSGPTCVRNRSLLGGGSLVLFALGLWPGSRGKDQDNASGRPSSSDTLRGKNPPRPGSQDLSSQRRVRLRPSEDEQQRKEVDDLIAQLCEHAESAMITEGDFRWDLVVEHVQFFTPRQLRYFVQTIVSDPSISTTNRAGIAGATAGYWVYNEGKQDPVRTRFALDALYEASLVLDQSADPSSLSYPTNLIFVWVTEGAVTYPGVYADFLVEHWHDWPKARALRASLLERIEDSEQRIRLEALPDR